MVTLRVRFQLFGIIHDSKTDSSLLRTWYTQKVSLKWLVMKCKYNYWEFTWTMPIHCVLYFFPPVSAGKCPSPLKNRDFVTMRSWLPLGNDYLIINYSVKHPVRLSFSTSVLISRGEALEACLGLLCLFLLVPAYFFLIYFICLAISGRLWSVHSSGDNADTDWWFRAQWDKCVENLLDCGRTKWCPLNSGWTPLLCSACLSVLLTFSPLLFYSFVLYCYSQLPCLFFLSVYFCALQCSLITITMDHHWHLSMSVFYIYFLNLTSNVF